MEIEGDFNLEIEPMQLEFLSMSCYITSLIDRTLEDFASRYDQIDSSPKAQKALVDEFKEWGVKGKAGLKVMYTSKKNLLLLLQQKKALKIFRAKYPDAKNCQKDFDRFVNEYEKDYGRPLEDCPVEWIELIE